jgi:hypothetical protein
LNRVVNFIAVALIILSGSYAWAGENITPYGDFCTQCTTYGAGKEMLTPDEAVKALEKYYGNKGCQLGAVSYKGRFVEVEIFKDGRNIDKVLFDRKTGRIRSIY